MSTPAILFGIYLLIGLVLMVVAVAAPGKRERTKYVEPSAGGGNGDFDAGLLIIIALLWPLWLVSLFLQKDRMK